MSKPQRPEDAYVVNGWYLDIPGLVSPHFETLEGVSEDSDTVKIVDGGSNKTFKFGSQIIDYGDMTLTRTRQGTQDDKTLAGIVSACQKQGVKFPVVAVKQHHGKEVFRLLLDGFRFVSKKYPTFDTGSSEKFIETFSATCDGVTEV